MPKELIPGFPDHYRDWVFTIRRTAGVIAAEIVVHLFKSGGQKIQSFRIPVDDFPGLSGIEARVDANLDVENWRDRIDNPPVGPLPPPGQ